jgi:predicted enzyme related to lactoylglutathione lyase
MTTMGNPFVHFEISAGDVDAARAFYTQVFDWKIGPPDPQMGDYALIDFGLEGSTGGLTKKMMPEQPTAWLSYVEVASVKDTMAKAEGAGAKAILPFQEIGPMGAIGIFMDPQGAAVGIWERGPMAPAKKVVAKVPKKSVKKPVKMSAKKPAAKKVATKKPAKAKGKKK